MDVQPSRSAVATEGVTAQPAGRCTSTRRRIAPEDNTYVLFAWGAIAVAVLAGFVLAILLPLARVAGWEWGLRWIALAQAHGHAQVMGWAGLFIFGMGYRLVPRFSAAPLRGRALVLPSFFLLALAVVLRLAFQPLADQGSARYLLPLAALLELGAVAIYAGLTVPLLVRPLRQRAGFAPYLVALAFWFVVQAVLGALWLWDTARAQQMILPSGRDQVLLTIQFYGVLLTAIFGVSFRTVPVFFKKPLPGARAAWPPFALLHTGLLAYTVAAVWRVYQPEEALRTVETASLLLVAAGTVAPIPLTGVWRSASRLRPLARNAAIFVQAAYAWIAVAAALLAYAVIDGLAQGRALSPAHADGVRHALALGTVTTMIVGMAYLITPAFAIPRQQGGGSLRDLRFIWGALMLAAALRLAGAWPDVPGLLDLRYWMMAVSGVLALSAIITFARAFYVSARTEPLPLPPSVIPITEVPGTDGSGRQPKRTKPS